MRLVDSPLAVLPVLLVLLSVGLETGQGSKVKCVQLATKEWFCPKSLVTLTSWLCCVKTAAVLRDRNCAISKGEKDGHTYCQCKTQPKCFPSQKLTDLIPTVNPPPQTEATTPVATSPGGGTSGQGSKVKCVQLATKEWFCPKSLATLTSWLCCVKTAAVLRDSNCAISKGDKDGHTYCQCKTQPKCFPSQKLTDLIPTVNPPPQTEATTSVATIPGGGTSGDVFCPASGQSMKEGEADQCLSPGIARVERMFNGTDPISICNAVLIRHTRHGVSLPTFFTSKFCSDMVINLLHKKIELDLKIGDHTFPLGKGRFSAYYDGGATFFVSSPRRLHEFAFHGPCLQAACVHKASMAGRINFDNCHAASYGSASSLDLNQTGLRIASVKRSPAGNCSSITDRLGQTFGEVNTMCFVSTTASNLFCANDMGGAVYCPADTGHLVLVGVIAFQDQCDHSPYLTVVPFPTSGPYAAASGR